MAKKKGAKAGRAKQKHKAQKSAGESTWNSASMQHRGLAYGEQDDDEDDEDDYNASHITFRGFDGATSRHFGRINPAIALRHHAIAFVSAGTNTPVDLEPTASVEEQMTGAEDVVVAVGEPSPLPSTASAILEQTDVAEVESVDSSVDDVPRLPSMDGANDSQSTSDGQALQYVIDTTGDLSLHTATEPYQTTAPRSHSPTPSSTSEDVVVFRGRNKPTIIDDPLPDQQSTTFLAPHKRPPAQQHKSKGTATIQSDTKKRTGNGWPVGSSKYTVEPDSTWQPAPQGAWWRHDKNTSAAGVDKAQDEAAISRAEQMTRGAAELTTAALHSVYLQTQRADKQARTATRADDDSHRAQRHRKLSKRGKQERAREHRLLQSLDLDESDSGEAAYRDYIENLKAQDEKDAVIAAVDTEDAALQIQLEESAIVDVDKDDTDWEDSALSASEEELIGEDFDDVYGRLIEDAVVDQDSSDLEDELDAAEREILHAEDELHGMRMRSMTDEQIARLFAKQVELGIDADELILDDGDIAFAVDGEGFGDINAARSGLADYLALGKGNKRSSRRRQRHQQDMAFPDASALADAVEQYGNDGFDIMDLDRPSLRATKKGRKDRLPAELEAVSDDDLRDNLRNAWDTDRAKKRLKKAEREELRAQGLLGALSKKGKADLDQKYQQGITMDEVRAELVRFLQDDGQTTRSFPPMDKTDRKALHEVANKLGLKSKSVGTGNNRSPVLYKTKSTVTFSEAALNRAMRHAGRHFLRNQHFKGEVAKKGAASIKRSGGTTYTGLRHGELVGAGAKEIGKDNFGSKLMEKMGWTRGTALGKDGEGVLHPVEQIMRIGKAGLG